MTILLPIKKSIFSISKYNISSIDFGKFGDDKKRKVPPGKARGHSHRTGTRRAHRLLALRRLRHGVFPRRQHSHRGSAAMGRLGHVRHMGDGARHRCAFAALRLS